MGVINQIVIAWIVGVICRCDNRVLKHLAKPPSISSSTIIRYQIINHSLFFSIQAPQNKTLKMHSFKYYNHSNPNKQQYNLDIVIIKVNPKSDPIIQISDYHCHRRSPFPCTIVSDKVNDWMLVEYKFDHKLGLYQVVFKKMFTVQSYQDLGIQQIHQLIDQKRYFQNQDIYIDDNKLEYGFNYSEIIKASSTIFYKLIFMIIILLLSIQ